MSPSIAELRLPLKYVEQKPDETSQYDDFDSDGQCQAPAYAHAIRRMKMLGLRTVADLGCGSAAKWEPYHKRFRLTLVDLPRAIEQLGHLVHALTLVEHNFEHDPLRLQDPPEAVVCMDVVEHLRDPSHLFATIRAMLRTGTQRAWISSPCRTHCPGISKKGPPRNKAHVREWTCEEFGELLAAQGFDIVELTHHAERYDAEGQGTMLFEVVDGP